MTIDTMTKALSKAVIRKSRTTENSFTPGPWTVRQTGYKGHASGAFYIEAKNTSDHRSACVAHIKRSTIQPMKANARLIAAAPDLLAALIAFEELGNSMELRKQISAAIAKAKHA